MAKARVNYEIQADERTGPFGVMDWLVVVLYVAELILGMWAVKLLQLYWKKIILAFKKKKLTKTIEKISQYTAEAVKNMKQALEKGYDVFKSPVSDDLQTALYREDSLSVDDTEQYIVTPEKFGHTVHLKLSDNQGKPVEKYVEIITHYLVTATGGTEKGIFKATLQTFQGDTVQYIIIKNSSLDENGQKTTVSLSLNNENPHNIII